MLKLIEVAKPDLLMCRIMTSFAHFANTRKMKGLITKLPSVEGEKGKARVTQL